MRRRRRHERYRAPDSRTARCSSRPRHRPSHFIALRIIPTIEEEIKIIQSAQAVRGVAKQRGLAGRIKDMKRYSMPLLVGSLRRASIMVMSIESRAFGAYPTRTFLEPPQMGMGGRLFRVGMIALVFAWYAALAIGLVHAVYVFAPW
jgi:energy-coupling factor transport system permease protein